MPKIKKVIIFNLLTVVGLIFPLVVLSDPSPDVPEKEITKNMTKANYCAVDDDCLLVHYACPFDRGAYLNKDEADRISKMVSDYLKKQTGMCVSDCAGHGGSPACRDGKCVPRICEPNKEYTSGHTERCLCPKGTVYSFLSVGVGATTFKCVEKRKAFAPRDGKTLLFLGQDWETIIDYMHDVIRMPFGFTTYTSIQNLEGLTSAADASGGIQNARSLLVRYPEAALQVGLYMVGALDGVIRGVYDKNIEKLASWLKKNEDTPVYLRIGYEFDLPQNKYEPQKYILAYRYIVDKLRAAGIENASYVWHSYVGFVEGSRERWYPGDDYVDWVAISFFDAFNTWEMKRIAEIAKKHDKPFMIAEATPRGLDIHQGEKTWKMWYQKLFSFIDEYDVKALCYINCDWEKIPMFKGQGWENARVQDNAFIKENWLKKIRGERFQRDFFFRPLQKTQ
ncbi:MAG: glycosyl hydrolase [Candidatus Aceula meridiana]|nr:glycosyl hydrolase [Candidatus Aceula meridiana]